MSTSAQRIHELYRKRPRDYFLRVSMTLFGLVLVGSWIVGNFQFRELLTERRFGNLKRFLGELVPYPLQGKAFDVEILFRWTWDLFLEKGGSALAMALAISVLSIVFAGLFGMFAGMLAARTLNTAEPYELSSRASRLSGWSVVLWVTRGMLMFFRGIPEYIWAFIFLTLFGPSGLAAILALGIHNSGVLGKLNAEIVDDLDPKPLRALRLIGATRSQLIVSAILPLVMGRFLLFFFYRWETCVRESTVLGLLGVVSLGYWIQDARSRNFYDEMLFLVMLGALLVLVGDLISSRVRARIRQA